MLKMVVIILVDQVWSPWERYLLFCNIVFPCPLSLEGENKERCHYIHYFIFSLLVYPRISLETTPLLLTMTNLHFLFPSTN